MPEHTVTVNEDVTEVVVTVVNQPSVVEVTSAAVGLVGPAGPQGPPGESAGTYTHTQTTPAAQWTITHGLGRPTEPTVLLAENPAEPVWADVVHPDANTTLVILPEPHAGIAYL